MLSFIIYAHVLGIISIPIIGITSAHNTTEKDKGIRMRKVLYEELLPEELVQRIQEMPVAYLPLGTLEWHGPHMPLGADGIQSKELFVRVAEKIGGVVLPMLFMGPDRVFHDGGKSFYGMDINTEGALNTYCVQQMKGSAYWMEKELFQNYLRSIFAQLFRVGVRIVVGHGHGHYDRGLIRPSMVILISQSLIFCKRPCCQNAQAKFFFFLFL